MKRSFRMIAILLMGMLLLLPSLAERQPAAAKDAPVTLRFCWWGSDPRHKATLNALNAYMKKNPHVKIEAEYMGYDGYYKKLLTQLAGGTAPDVMQLDTQWTSELTTQGDFFLDLNRYKTRINTKVFSKALIKDFCLVGNKMIGVPAGVSVVTMLCNKEFFDKYKIPANTVWTWDKLLEYGKKVHDQNKNDYLISGDIDIINRLIVRPYLSQKTGDVWIRNDYSIAFDKKLLAETLKYLSELYKTGTMEPFGESSAFVGKTEQNIRWIGGNIGMAFALTSTISQMKSTAPAGRKFFAAALPMHKNAKQSGNPQRPSQLLAINKSTRNAAEAVKFLNWFVNDREASLILGDSRSTPASSVARKALVDGAKIDPLIADALDYANKKPGKSWGPLTENSEISQINKDAIEKMIFDKLTPDQAADEILKGYKAKLNELKSSQR
ncbi:oligogalacturonide transport system substrate-binding protein [Hydrogenispora ethanolica]|uniref:Oligogalacturonide transport system substrate-binding protein n=1 Tax=Hydrogenispora ethanolica TaxID=1082276 RepID=A0A4R1R018_HYDET|nr:extracellular solute-binding protein [Hydrogenispora ethanolica]TCL58608.1 oligogalacturonide transport system substrate-binding protein [Hydrogenispora ethanolica]